MLQSLVKPWAAMLARAGHELPMAAPLASTALLPSLHEAVPAFSETASFQNCGLVPTAAGGRPVAEPALQCVLDFAHSLL